MYFEAAITTEAFAKNLPVDRDEVKVQTDADITVFFWSTLTGAYETVGTDVPSPGGFLGVISDRAKITTATTANVKFL